MYKTRICQFCQAWCKPIDDICFLMIFISCIIVLISIVQKRIRTWRAYISQKIALVEKMWIHFKPDFKKCHQITTRIQMQDQLPPDYAPLL